MSTIDCIETGICPRQRVGVLPADLVETSTVHTEPKGVVFLPDQDNIIIIIFIIIIIIIITSNLFMRRKSQPYRRIRGAV